MNIPPDPPNDLNRGPPSPVPPPPHPIIGSIQSFVTQIIDANREWTDAKDFAFRLALPLFSIAATAIVSKFLDKRDALLKEAENDLHLSKQQLSSAQKDLESRLWLARQQLMVERREGELNLQLAREQLLSERRLFEAERGRWANKSLSSTVDELMAEGNTRSYKAVKEIDSLQPLFRQVLKVRCSPFTPKEHRLPVEKEIRSRLLKHPSPLDQYGSLKVMMLEDTMEIFKKDVAHCDSLWPLGSGDNGELYKVYAENWKLRVELEKHKQVLEQLKKSQHSQR